MGIEVTIECNAGERAGDEDFSLGVLRNGRDLLVQRGLGG